MGLQAKPRRKFKRTTDSDHELSCSPNLLAQHFIVDAPNRVWCSDITYVRTWEGWLYVCVVVDLFARKVVGWHAADHMRAELVTTAFDAAVGRRGVGPGLIFHCDRGSQLELNGSSQHRFVGPSVDDRRELHQVSSSRGSCAAGY
ncbi:MAG: DDE-type integrase/transposase/recombinase [Nannocystales bacterium]